eukprot:9403357-Prorocentrum_lima.AAC.1
MANFSMGCRGVFAGLEETENGQPGFWPFDAVQEIIQTGDLRSMTEKTVQDHIWTKFNKWFSICLSPN